MKLLQGNTTTKSRRTGPRIGDIVEIPTPKGLAYAQYTHLHDRPPHYGELIRVLPGLYELRPSDWGAIASQNERFFAFFPLRAALARRIVSVVAHAEVPERCKDFPVFRTGTRNPATGRVDVWWLWDGDREWRVRVLTPEQLELPIRGVWNDTLLIGRIVEGWSPRDEV